PHHPSPPPPHPPPLPAALPISSPGAAYSLTGPVARSRGSAGSVRRVCSIRLDPALARPKNRVEYSLFERGLRPRSRSWGGEGSEDRKSTRLNSSHVAISYAVFC